MSPSAASAFSAAAFQPSAEDMSASMAMAPLGRLAASDFSLSTERATSATFAPSLASVRAMASPMPRLAPVTTAVLPLKL